MVWTIYSVPFQLQTLNTLSMMQFLRRLILIMSLAGSFGILPQTSYATHLAGSDISYTCLGGNTYRIDLTFYRDCRGSDAPLGVTIELISASCNQYFSIELDPVLNTGTEITYPCPTLITSCDDSTSGTPGIQQWKYSGIVTMPMQCSDWVISWKYCCRNCDITTMVQQLPCNVGTNPSMYVSTHMDNLNYNCNSSPRFTNIPIAFVCIGQNFTYNHGVVDPDGDSIAFMLVDPLTDVNSPIQYLPGYSATNPVTSSPALTIDPVTGDIVMTPTQVEVGVLSVLVLEYRNGVLIGSVVRDMEIYVRACTNTLPTASGFNGTNVRDTTICAGTNLCFDIIGNDVDPNQNVFMTWNQGIANATFTVSGFPYPTGRFCWTPTSANISTSPHVFTVAVRDDACPNNGYQTFSYRIYVNSPAVNVSVTDIVCNNQNNGMVSIVPVNPGNYGYLWSPGGQTTSSISNLAAGLYSVQVIDSITGCAGSFSATITNPPLLSATASTLTQSCAGSGSAFATITGGVGPYSYSWDTNPVSTTDTISNLAAGNYTVIVTDSRGCTSASTVNVQPATSVISINVDTLSALRCYGDTNGVIGVTASGGSGTLMYSWNTSPVQNTQVANGLAAGAYTVTITDGTGCTNSQTLAISSPLQLQVQLGSSPASCNNSDGSAFVVSVSGGVSGYSYLWNGGNTNDTLYNVPTGLYDVVITDANNCTIQQSVVVNSQTISLTTSSNSPTCFGDGNGSATVLVQSGGTGPFVYVWNTSPVQNSSTATSLSSGTYNVSVTDANNCTAVAQVTITQPTLLTVQASSNPACFGSTGVGIAIASGGTVPYSYSWNPAVSGGPVVVVPPGTYTVTLTDARGCTASSSTTVTENPQINIVATTISQPTCNGFSNGSIDISVSGGTGTGYEYYWTPGSVITQDLNNITAGVYQIVVGDSYNCTQQLTLQVDQPGPVNSFAGGDTAICTGNSIILNAQLASGHSGQWSSVSGVVFANANNPNTIVLNLGAGLTTLTWTVTNQTGCTGTSSIDVDNLVNYAATAGNDTTYCGLNALQLNGNTYPTFIGYWTANTSATFDDATKYNAFVSPMNGDNILVWTISNQRCSASDTILVNYENSCELELPTGFSPNGDGYNDGYFIKGLTKYPNNTFTVFNRWGNLVYSKDNYTNTDWKGQNRSGDDLPEGTYFVIFEVKNSSIKKNTYVDLRRYANK